MKRQLIFAILAFSFCNTYSQTGGNSIYNFLDLTNSARAAALGGQQISIYDDDLNFVYQNPSLLNESMSNQLALNYIPYLAKINYGYVSYARTFNNLGNFAAGIYYINYGQFTEADDLGNKTGEFSANDYSLNISYSRGIIDSLFNIGVTYKIIYSQLEIYKSMGMALDAGIT
jgi:Type IX secretion system protein PorV